MGNNSPKDHRLGRIGKAAFAGKKCQHVHSIIERAASYAVMQRDHTAGGEYGNRNWVGDT